MHVAQPLLEPHNSLAVGGEAEMAGLDDAGMHWPDRNLVEALAFRRQERIGQTLDRSGRARAERMADAPEAEVEPRPRIRQTDRLQAMKSADGAFEPDRGRMRSR